MDGQFTYLNNLWETHRYLGDVAQALSRGEELQRLCQQLGREASRITRQLKLLRAGEPLCRVVCVRGDDEWELDELPSAREGRYEFQFRRNRYSLEKSMTFVRQGNALASQGELANAMLKYDEANDVDPYDPDPLYQRGMCLLELGAYAKARESFEEVERLAPGWFRCRSSTGYNAFCDRSVTD